jgi:hypothetical protein
VRHTSWITFRYNLKNTPNPPRWFLPLLVGLLTFAVVWTGRADPIQGLDFDYFWSAGRAVWLGQNPYHAAQQSGGYPYYYPGTAAVFLAPFGALPFRLAVSLFTALAMALLCLSVSDYRRWIVVSAPALTAILLGQWSPWLTAGIGLPWLSFVWAAKPSIGLALFAAWPSRKAVYGGLAIVVLSLLVLPSWPADWLQALSETPQHRAPVMRPGGGVLLLAFLRWRSPEGRLLGVLALVPHTASIIEHLPLLLIPQTRARFWVLMGSSYLTLILINTVAPGRHGSSLEAIATMLDGQWPLHFALMWLPCLYFVLRQPSAASASRPAAPSVPPRPSTVASEA